MMIRNIPRIAGTRRFWCSVTAGLVLSTTSAFGQAVIVSLRLETNRVAIGETTSLLAYAQIAPAFRTNSDRIFSWYVDLVHTNGTVATVNYAMLARPASDRNPQTSSAGQQSGTSLRGIYDTFMNLSGAGKDSPVLLFSVPVRGETNGATTFRIERGSGVNQSHDFIVAPAGGGDPYTGGDYSQAEVTLNVGSGGALPVKAALAYAKGPAGQNQVTLTFPAAAGSLYTVESRDSLAPASPWQALPGAPHNAGSVRDTNTVTARFYRVRIN